MEIEFSDPRYDRLETDKTFTAGFAPEIVRAYRMRIQGLRSARDQRDLHAMRSWRFEKLKGKRLGQYSIRLNDQYRLIFEIRKTDDRTSLRILGIEDYH
jgi:proteic killer suppression protein